MSIRAACWRRENGGAPASTFPAAIARRFSQTSIGPLLSRMTGIPENRPPEIAGLDGDLLLYRIGDPPAPIDVRFRPLANVRVQPGSSGVSWTQ